jgi:hypothetical protein
MRNNIPYLYGNLAEHWLDPKLAKLGLYEEGSVGTFTFALACEEVQTT